MRVQISVFIQCFRHLFTECASSQADIVFVVDDSTSVQRTNYRLVLGFIQDLVRTLIIGPDAVQVGFLSFSNTMKSQFYFKTFSDKDQLINKIGAVKYRGGGTNIARALSEAYQKHFQDPSTGGRDAAAKVLVLITDGASEGTEQISQTIRDAGIKILCVGITSGVDLQQLRDIAGNEERVFKASTFRTLGDIAGNLITKTCEGKNITFENCSVGHGERKKERKTEKVEKKERKKKNVR